MTMHGPLLIKGMTAKNPRPTKSPQTSPSRNRRPILIAIIATVAVILSVGVWVWVSTANKSGSEAAGVLHQDTRMGAVRLTVSNLDLMRSYYQDSIGLSVLSESDEQVELGSGDETLVILTLQPELAFASPTTAGLYHTAILYPDRVSLASVMQNMAETAANTYQGAADHRVSLAFYFGDPEGNGVELYVDRPEDEWEWSNGRVTMGSEALDPNEFIAENLTNDASQDPTVGHVHLRVGDLDSAREFYVDTLGFDITSESDGALFMSAGGYHHHLAANIWNSQNASPRTPALGLGHFTVVLNSEAELEAANARISEADLSVTTIDGGVAVDDPWGNTVHLLVTN